MSAASLTGIKTSEINCDLNRMCRICLSHNTDMNRLFIGNDCKIVNKIEFCTGVLLRETEGLPKQICKFCEEKLSIAHTFKTLCLLSVQTLEKFLENIKEEVTYENEFDNNFEVVDIKTDIQGDNEESRVPICESKKAVNSKVIKRKVRGPYNKPGKPRIAKNKFKRLACEPCDLKFPNRELSNKHKREYHSASWICEICGKTFTYQASHQNHIRTHFPPRLCCDLCDYRCSNKNDMGKHMRIHLGIKEYNCRLCSHTFTTVSNRLDHERRYHQKLKRFQCSLCDMAFYDKTKLNRHVDSHNSIKRFKCDICNCFYTRRCHWKKHLEKQHNVIVPSQRPGRRRGGIVNKTVLDGVS